MGDLRANLIEPLLNLIHLFGLLTKRLALAFDLSLYPSLLGDCPLQVDFKGLNLLFSLGQAFL